MSGARHQLAPIVTVEKIIDRAVAFFGRDVRPDRLTEGMVFLSRAPRWPVWTVCHVTTEREEVARVLQNVTMPFAWAVIGDVGRNIAF